MIASDNIFDCDFAKCGLTNNLIEVPHEIEFNLIHQVFLNVDTNIYVILGDVNGDSDTIKSNLSGATLTTSQSVLPNPSTILFQFKHQFLQAIIVVLQQARKKTKQYQ